MIITETKIIDEKEFDYTYSDLRVYIKNELGQEYIAAYDLKGHTHIYTETDKAIDDGTEEDELQKWLDFLKEYEFLFGDKEYIYSKYKVVKKCMEKDLWAKFKPLMTEDAKDLFDAAIEFSSADDVFKKGVYIAYRHLNLTMLDIRNLLDECLK